MQEFSTVLFLTQEKLLPISVKLTEYLREVAEVLEYESDIYNQVEFKRSDAGEDKNRLLMFKYVHLEMIHVANNQLHDPYSSMKYPHRFFNLSFEKEVRTPLFKTEGSRAKSQIMETYIGRAMENTIQGRTDYDA